jgi:4-amino-4-deoxy-L-arabinose transferase-like glycosyltransferase
MAVGRKDLTGLSPLKGISARPVRSMLVIIGVYLVLAVLFAVYTPAWQNPDEPAHYNYVKYLAEQYRLPVLKLGDYQGAYLWEIKAAHFPPEMSIDPIRYEFHQPPLYYLLAAAVYQLFGGALLPLRLLTAAIGAVLLVVVYWMLQEVAPRRPGLALAATAFIAWLPMHLAQSAAVGNDLLAELLLATIVLLAIRYLKMPVAGADGRRAVQALVVLGIATGLAFVTKSSIYVALPLAAAVIAARHLWLEERPFSGWALVKALGWYLLPAVALALPWWMRNMAQYGGPDLLGLQRHNQVVAGQLRTAQYLAANGMANWLGNLGLTTFHSFWGQFGWMGVLLDARLYQGLAIWSGVALTGLSAWAVSMWQQARNGWRPARWQVAAGGLLVLLALSSAAGYLWYNIQFVQYQGRYLFTALPAIGLAVAAGWREALRRERAWLIAALLIGGAVAVAVGSMLAGDMAKWPVLMLGGSGAAFLVRRLVPPRWDPLVEALPYLVLIPLDVVCLFLFIVPQLTP